MSVNFRFFSRVTPSGQHIKLFILAIDDDKEELYEVTLVDGELVETSELMNSMVNGFQDMEEINQEVAMRIYENDGAGEAIKKRFG